MINDNICCFASFCWSFCAVLTMIIAKIVIAITLSILDIQLLSISSLSFDFHFQISMVQP